MVDAISTEHKNALQKLRQKLHDMDPEPVIEHLYSKSALSLMQTERIKSKPDKDDKNTTLMKIFEQQKDWVYHCFLDYLLRSGQNNVLNILGERTCKLVFCSIIIFYKF